MARRHEFRPGDWASVALRLDEIISAHSGEDPFEEALKLLVARMAHEASGEEGETFLARTRRGGEPREVNRLLALADARWPGVLDPGAATRLAGPELARCAAALRSVRLLGGDLVGLDAIFEFIVNKAAKGQKGQYFTPRHVIAEIIAMVEPMPGERLVDPACGSGGFLRHALLREPRCAAWGFDQDPRACRVARVMMAASGQPPGRVARGDSLRRPGVGVPSIETCMESMDIRFAGFDVVVTNPPFAGDVGEDHARAYELARGHRAERDVLFIERCVELLRPGGRLAMVLPHNKVTGSPWRRARRWMLERLRVVAVLGLGRNTFRPHTSQKACVLLGIKRAAPVENFEEEEVLFFISDEDGKDRRGRLLHGADGRSVAHDLPEATPLVQQRFRGLRGRDPGHEGPARVAGGRQGPRGGA